MLEALKAQGADIPDIGEKRSRPGTRVRPSKIKQDSTDENKNDDIETQSNTDKNVEVSDKQIKLDPEAEEKIKDAWDEDSDSDDFVKVDPMGEIKKTISAEKNDSDESDSGESNNEGEESSETSNEDTTENEKIKERAFARIQVPIIIDKKKIT